MAIYTVQAKVSIEEAVTRAKDYFGKGNLGLEVVEETPVCLRMTGGGGHVRVTSGEGVGTVEFELKTREWDYHVRRFMRELAA
jgi:hypothetical protein